MAVLKLFGSQLIAAGKPRNFVAVFAAVFTISLSCAVAAVVGAALLATPVAYDFGETACVYASDAGCAAEFADVFAGRDSLSSVFEAFGPTVGLQLLFIALRAGLAICHDFAFLAKAACAAVVVVYLPAIVVARLVFDSALSFWVAMYLPHFALTLAFGWRMHSHIRALWAGRPGPWTPHMRRMGVGETGTEGERAPLDKPLLAAVEG